MRSDMAPDEFREAGHAMVEWIARYLEDPARHPVLAGTKPGDLRRALPSVAPLEGQSFEQIMADFESQVLPACTLWNHPRFFSYFAVSSSGPGILAEFLSAALNMNGMLWKSSPAVTELEQVTLGWLREWLGMPPEFFGIIHDTASTATMHAILAARHKAHPETRTRGARNDMVLYTSEEAHSSVEKGALALGVGKDNVRLIGVDESFRMKAAELERAITADRQAGKKPFCVVATVGTTSTTAIDPVPEIAAICERESLWLHVDAAYGGSVALVPGYTHYFDAVHRADSFVINPHKWLFTPIDLSAFYTRHPEVLRAALSLVPEYLRTKDDPDALNYMDYGVALGRRFRALKLWFVMRYFGRRRMAEIIGEYLNMTRALAARIAADVRFELCAPVTMGLICFRLKGDDARTRQLLDDITATRRAFLSQTVLNGQFVLRWSIGNIHTTQADVDETWNLVLSLV